MCVCARARARVCVGVCVCVCFNVCDEVHKAPKYFFFFFRVCVCLKWFSGGLDDCCGLQKALIVALQLFSRRCSTWPQLRSCFFEGRGGRAVEHAAVTVILSALDSFRCVLKHTPERQKPSLNDTASRSRNPEGPAQPTLLSGSNSRWDHHIPSYDWTLPPAPSDVPIRVKLFNSSGTGLVSTSRFPDSPVAHDLQIIMFFHF